MLLLPRSTKIYMGRQPVRMSRSFDGLSNEVREVLRRDPLSGHIFVFFNRRRTMAKLILWTRGGFTVVAKRLERGTFSVPRVSEGEDCIELDIHELALLLEGVSWEGRRLSPRWEPTQHRRGDQASPQCALQEAR